MGGHAIAILATRKDKRAQAGPASPPTEPNKLLTRDDAGVRDRLGPRRLPDRRPARARRHGDRLPRRAAGARPPGGDQGDRAAACGGRGLSRAVPARVAPGRCDRAPERGPGVRGRRCRRRDPLSGDALHRGHRPRVADRPGPCARARPGGGDHRPGRRGARRGPREGARPPRHQAGQHPDRIAARLRARLSDRLRADQERRRGDRGAHRDRAVAGHGRLRGAGADRGQARRRPQ